MIKSIALAGVVLIAAVSFAAAPAGMVIESPREIPVAAETDIVVVGGSTGAVSAAVAAASAGARVYLVAPRPYLGEDICATMRLWLEPGDTADSPLAKAIFCEEGLLSRPMPKSLPLTYQADLPSAGVHKDTARPSRLSDGVVGRAETQSVQYDGDVTIAADLGSVQAVGEARIVLFYRLGGDFNPRSVTVETSADQREWKTAGTVNCRVTGDAAITASVPVSGQVRYARFHVKRDEDAKRLLVGEILLIAPGQMMVDPKAFCRGPIRPMHVKKTLDDALLAAKVPFLYSAYATDVLRDQRGELAGVVIANRAGRQAILAKVVIDATDRAWVARMAGARFTAFPAGPQAFSFIQAGGEVAAAEGLSSRKLNLAYIDPATGEACDLVEHTLRLPMDGSFASIARAEQHVRDLVYNPGVQANTEELFQVPPDSIRGAAGAGDGLSAFRPQGISRLWVLGGCADMSREQAAKLLRAPELIKAGERIGRAAAVEAKDAAAPQSAHVAAPAGQGNARGEVRESLAGLRPAEHATRTVSSPQRGLPILGEYDVVVIGGGTGGAPAGIAAARDGAKVLVLEYLHGMGGVGTMGLISSYYFGYRKGFTGQIPLGNRWNPLEKSDWYRRTLRQAGGEVWFGVIGCGALVDGGTVRGAIIATPQGRGVVLAKTVIDSTGNADIAAAAGAQTVHTGADELAQQGTGLPSMKLKPSYNNTDFTIVDETDMVDLWHVLVYAKSKYTGQFDMGQLIDSRERRRIVGDFTMTLADEMNGRTYPDTISISYSDYDTHGYTVDPYTLMDHPQRKGVTVNIPYRCLLPSGLDGLLVTGLGISVHRDAVPLTRMQADIQNQGYAAGMIAATAAKTGQRLRNVDLPAIQKRLAAMEIIPAEAVGAKDSYPLPDSRIAEAVANARKGKDIAVIASHPERAMPLLKQAYAAAETEKDKLTYAQILAVMGDATGLETLIAALDAAEWDKGWNYTGMGQYGNALSPVDTMIVALGRTHDRRALPAILRKVKLLDAKSVFSHHRAVALALESIGDPAAAGPLVELLAKPGMRGYVSTSVEVAQQRSGRDPNDNSTRATSIRELSLGRALYRCGDKDNIGREILTQYSHDLRGHLARHAWAVLDERK